MNEPLNGRAGSTRPRTRVSRLLGLGLGALIWSKSAAVAAQEVSADDPAGEAGTTQPSSAVGDQPPITAYPAGTDQAEPGPPPGPATKPPVASFADVPVASSMPDTGVSHRVEPEPSARAGTDAAKAAPILAGFGRNEGAFLRSEDGRFALRVGGLLQVRLSGSTTSDVSRRFDAVPLARVYFQGNVAEPWLGYFIQAELAGQQSPIPDAPIAQAPRLIDAWLDLQPASWFGVRLGMMRPAFTRSWIVGLQRMLMFDRTDANAFFRTHGPLPQVSARGTHPTVPWDRDIGVQASGAPFGGYVEYALGVFTGNGALMGRNGDKDVMPLARIAINPLGPVAYEETTALTNPDSNLAIQLGFAAYQNRYRVDYTDDSDQEVNGTEEQKTLGADVTVYGATVHFSAEGYLRSRRVVTGERHTERGLMATLGWMFFAPYLEMATRASLIDPRVGTPLDIRRVYDAELNYYHLGNNFRTGLRYSLANNQASSLGGAPGVAYTLPANETTHTVMLLTQLYF